MTKLPSNLGCWLLVIEIRPALVVCGDFQPVVVFRQDSTSLGVFPRDLTSSIAVSSKCLTGIEVLANFPVIFMGLCIVCCKLFHLPVSSKLDLYDPA
jgi:hypothetical protein